jgi:hypothetical protein
LCRHFIFVISPRNRQCAHLAVPSSNTLQSEVREGGVARRRCPWPRDQGICLVSVTWRHDVFLRCLSLVKSEANPVLPNHGLHHSNFDLSWNRRVRQEGRCGKWREDEVISCRRDLRQLELSKK